MKYWTLVNGSFILIHSSYSMARISVVICDDDLQALTQQLCEFGRPALTLLFARATHVCARVHAYQALRFACTLFVFLLSLFSLAINLYFSF